MKLLKFNLITYLLLFTCLIIFAGCEIDPSSGESYIITYYGNGQDSGQAPASKNYKKGNIVYISVNTGNLTKTGYYLAGWNTRADGTGTSYAGGQAFLMDSSSIDLYAQWVDMLSFESKTFRTQKATDNTWYNVSALKLASGSSCIVYAEQSAVIPIQIAQAIVTEYEANIHSQITGAFGTFTDFDGNGKIIFLLLDIIDGFDGTGGYVAGYFDPTHMFSRNTYSNSNQADMLYIDTYPGLTDISSIYSTIAHELQHLINFSQTYLKDGREQDLWINEGLSSAAEYIYAGTQQDRIDYFNDDPVGTIAYGNNFFVWNGFWESEYGDVLADYSTVYLFFQWLRIHASNGNGIYKEIINSNDRDYRAVTAAASNRINSQFSSWDKLLGTWMLANCFNDASGNYGYKGEIVTQVWILTGTNGGGNEFSPGEGIFSNLAGNSHNKVSLSGANIKYAAFNDASSIDITAPYTGQTLLTFNANSNYEGSDEDGFLANIAGINPQTKIMSMSRTPVKVNSLPKTYPIGFNDVNKISSSLNGKNKSYFNNKNIEQKPTGKIK